MKKYFPGLFSFAILGLVVTTSCDNTSDIADKDVTEVQSYNVYENHVPLTGEDNMHDLGGFVGEGGKRIIKHKLFRSGELSALTSADKDALTAIGIKQIIDLRTVAERYSVHDQLINGAINYQLPLLDDYTGGKSSQLILMDRIAQGKINAYPYMMQFYVNINKPDMANWEATFDLLETGNTTLWHCANGKDRSGITAALVLASLGVDKATIIKDYMASNVYLSASNQKIIGDYERKYGQDADKNLRPMLEAEQAYITAFFNTIDTKYAGMNNFLDAIKVDRAKMKKLFLEK